MYVGQEHDKTTQVAKPHAMLSQVSTLLSAALKLPERLLSNRHPQPPKKHKNMDAIWGQFLKLVSGFAACQ